VVAHSRYARQVVCARIELPWEPNCLQLVAAINLALENLEGKGLEPWVRGATRDVFAQTFSAGCCLRDNAAKDEHTTKIVEERSKPAPPKKRR